MPNDLTPAAATAVRQFNYVLSARSVNKKGGFGSEVGKPRFLKVPRGVPATPEHDVGPETWLKDVVDLADGAADDVISPTGDVLVFVHGYNNSAQEIADRHRILQDMLLEERWR